MKKTRFRNTLITAISCMTGILSVWNMSAFASDRTVEKTMQRVFVLEFIDSENSPLGEITLCQEGDFSEDTAISVSIEDFKNNQEMLPEEDLVRIIDDEVYVNYSLVSKVMNLDISDLDDLITMGWIQIPEMNWSELINSFEKMPGDRQWYQAFEMILSACDYKEEGNVISVSVDNSSLLGIVEIMEQYIYRIVKPIADIDWNSLAGPFFDLVQGASKEYELENEDLTDLVYALNEYRMEENSYYQADALNYLLNQNKDQKKTLSEIYLKWQMLSELYQYHFKQYSNYNRYSSGFETWIPDQLFRTMVPELDDGFGIWKRNVIRWIGENRIHIRGEFDENGSFSISNDMDEAFQIHGTISENGFRAAITTDEEEIAACSFIINEYGLEGIVGAGDSNWLTFSVKPSDNGFRFNIQSLDRYISVSGDIVLTDDGLELKMNQGRIGAILSYLPFSGGIQFDTAKGETCSITISEIHSSLYNLDYRTKMTYTEEIVEKKEIQRPDAVSMTDLIRPMMDQQIQHLKNILDEYRNEDSSKWMDHDEWESEMETEY